MNGSQKTKFPPVSRPRWKTLRWKLRVRLFWCSVPDAVSLVLLMWIHFTETTTSWGPDELRAHLCAATGFISSLLAVQPRRARFWARLHAAVLTHQDYSDLLDVKNAHKEKSDVSHILVNCTSCPLVSCCRDSAQPQDRRQPRWAWMTVNPKPLILLYSSILTN